MLCHFPRPGKHYKLRWHYVLSLHTSFPSQPSDPYQPPITQILSMSNHTNPFNVKSNRCFSSSVQLSSDMDSLDDLRSAAGFTWQSSRYTAPCACSFIARKGLYGKRSRLTWPHRSMETPPSERVCVVVTYSWISFPQIPLHVAGDPKDNDLLPWSMHLGLSSVWSSPFNWFVLGKKFLIVGICMKVSKSKSCALPVLTALVWRVRYLFLSFSDDGTVGVRHTGFNFWPNW